MSPKIFKKPSRFVAQWQIGSRVQSLAAYITSVHKSVPLPLPLGEEVHVIYMPASSVYSCRRRK